MKTLRLVLVFIAALLLCAAIAWLGGWDFNTRNPEVAYLSTLAVAISALAAFFVENFR